VIAKPLNEPDGRCHCREDEWGFAGEFVVEFAGRGSELSASLKLGWVCPVHGLGMMNNTSLSFVRNG
jgi:hypothetical protein